MKRLGLLAVLAVTRPPLPAAARRRSPTARSRSASSTTSPASMPTSAASGRSRPPRWRSRISAARCSARRSRSSPPTTRTSPTSPRTSPAQWYDTEQVDSIMELTTSSVALAVQGMSKEKKKIDIVTGAATTELTGKQCSPYGFHWAYDTHALAVGTGGALVAAGRRHLVLPDRRLCLRLFARGADQRVRQERQGGKVLGAVRHPLATTDYLLLPAAGAVVGRQGDRPRQCRPRHRQRHQAGAPSSASSPAASSWRRCSSPSPKCTASASRRRRG